MKFKKPRYDKLNLGCGRKVKIGFLNVDGAKLPGVDVVHNLNRYPWPFPDNSFSLIEAEHVIEHLDDFIRAMKELHRITKKGGTIYIEVPYFNSVGMFRDPTHKTFFAYSTFNYFTEKLSRWEGDVHYFPKLFKIRSKRLNYKILKHDNIINKTVNFFINQSPENFERFFTWLIPIEELIVELEPIK